MSKENPKQNDNIGQDNGSKIMHKKKINQLQKYTATKTWTKSYSWTKSMELTKFVDEKFMYIGNTESANETKAHLKSKVTEIENKKMLLMKKS
ncbi:hypothetical protein NWQ33_00860 [Mycoplasmopsis cynos]|nr:hypothetical protein [Mycoplasmopsis cynos]